MSHLLYRFDGVKVTRKLEVGRKKVIECTYSLAITQST